MASPPCPPNSFGYNATLCACDPGYLLDAAAKSCHLFNVSGGEWVVDSGVDPYSSKFPEMILSFEPIKKFTQSQAIFVEATLVLLLAWLLFCFFVRFRPLGEGRTIWFKIRWWISRLDVCFATRHWLDDQKVVKKRKTELGGTFSIASWILFIGLFAALLYQSLLKRNVEVHNVRATNAPDLASFNNDMEFNITTISSMTCSHLRDLGTLSVGNPGFFEYRVTPLSNFVKFSCQNTSLGPTITLKCSNCQLIQDITYISWKFVDLPNAPASAVGFQFNLSAKNHASLKHLSLLSGILKNGSNTEDKPITFRGAVPNVLKFNLFPRIYRNLHDLKLIQPLFHEFLPGSSYSEASQLQASLRSSDQGLVNVTLLVNFLSSYIVEVDRQNIVGPVSFLADLGGLFCISIGIFFYCLVQCEYRIKKLRNEDSVMRRIRSRRKALDHWDKLRKYVMFTWSCNGLDDTYHDMHARMCCNGFMIEPSNKNGSTNKQKQKNRKDTLSFDRKITLPDQKKTTLELGQTQVAQHCVSKSSSNLGQGLSGLRSEAVPESTLNGARSNGKRDYPISSCEEGKANPQKLPASVDYSLPPPPSLEFKTGSEISMSDIQKNIQSLYDYNVMMRERLIATQDMLLSLTRKASSSSVESHRKVDE